MTNWVIATSATGLFVTATHVLHGVETIGLIGLVEFLAASGMQVETGKQKIKIHLACWNGIEHPIDVFFAGDFDTWQGDQKNRNFTCPQVLSLVDLGNSFWLFVGLYDVVNCRPNPKRRGRFFYSMKLVPGQDDLIARIVVHHKRSRASYIWHKPELQLPIVEIRRERMTIGEFPGYNGIVISHDKLQIITRQKIASWHGALTSVKGIYLITDTTTGKHYVGKASGDAGIWDRWCAYAKNGHGGNEQLMQLLKAHGDEYRRNFQYSILEIADTHSSESDILKRESYWMNALRTRDFGLN